MRDTSTKATVQQFGYACDRANNRLSTDINGTVKQSTFNNVNGIQGTTAGGLTRFQGAKADGVSNCLNSQRKIIFESYLTALCRRA